MNKSKGRNKKQISNSIFLLIITLSLSLCVFFIYNSNDDGQLKAIISTDIVKNAIAKAPKIQSDNQAADKTTSPTSKDDVTVYITSWCHYCKITIDFLKKHSIPFVVKDVEKNSDYREEMMTKARACRGGVPVLEVNGAIHCGYNPALLKSLAR